MRISFKLKEPSETTSLILMVINYRYQVNGRYKPVIYSTRLNVPIVDWKKKDKREYPWDYVKPRKQPKINRELDDFYDKAKEVMYKLLKDGMPTPKQVKVKLDKVYSRHSNSNPTNLMDFIDQFIIDAKSGKRLTRRKKMRYSSTTHFSTLKIVLEAYQKSRNRKLDFMEIDKDFYNDFIQYCNAHKISKDVTGYKPNTIGTLINVLNTIMRSAEEVGLHKLTDYYEFEAISEDVHAVALTEDELKKITEVDLSEVPHLEKYRDVFLVGCWTGQRFSDYSRISDRYVSGNLITLRQDKTGAKVVIPIFAEIVPIMKKYDNNMPKFSQGKMNTNIKTICKMAKINEQVVYYETRDGTTKEKMSEKYNMVASHTARRSFCTNLYLRGVPTLAIMRLSGHKTEAQFLKYIKVSEEENAKMIEKIFIDSVLNTKVS